MVSNSVEIGNICDLQEGYVNPSQKVPGYFGGGIRWLRAVDLNDAEVFETSRTLSQEGYESAGKSALMFPANSIGISKSGTIGRLGILRKPMCGNRAVINIVPKQSNDLRYIFYSLRMARQSIIAMAVGSVQKNLYVPVLESLTIPWPEQHVRDTIVDIAGSIDDKITVNTRVNDYLEELGQALLGEYLSSCNDVCSLGSIMDFGNGFAFKSDTYTNDGRYKILTIKNVQDGNIDCSNSNRIDALPKKMKDFCKLKLGDVVLSLTGNVGRVGIVSEEDCLLNQRVAVLHPNQSFLLPGLYFFFRQRAFQNEMIGIAKGTAQANLSPVETLRLDIPYNEHDFSDLSKTLTPIFDSILANKIESLRLAELRDTLLPKLMSGEIDVSQVNLTQLNNHLYVQ